MRNLFGWFIYSGTADKKKLFDSGRFRPVCYRPALIINTRTALEGHYVIANFLDAK